MINKLFGTYFPFFHIFLHKLEKYYLTSIARAYVHKVNLQINI